MTRTPPASTYDDDFFAWSRDQAEALRALPVSLVGSAVDIAHIAEEIEDLGKRDLREVGSFLKRAVEHLIKIDACPTSADLPHWRSETRHFASSAFDAFTPSMRQLIDMPRIWLSGRKKADGFLKDIAVPYPTPVACPFALDDLLTDDFDVDRALSILAAAKQR